MNKKIIETFFQQKELIFVISLLNLLAFNLSITQRNFYPVTENDIEKMMNINELIQKILGFSDIYQKNMITEYDLFKAVYEDSKLRNCEKEFTYSIKKVLPKEIVEAILER